MNDEQRKAMWAKKKNKVKISDIADKVVKNVKPKYVYDLWKDGSSLKAQYSVSNTDRGTNNVGLADNDNEFNRNLKKRIIEAIRSNRYDSMKSAVSNHEKQENNWFSQYDEFDVTVGNDVIQIQKMWETRNVKKTNKYGHKDNWDQHRLLVKIKDDDKIYAVTNWVDDG